MLGLLGDEWTLLVVQQALMGARRYAEFQARLPISNSVLTARLRSLTGEGVLDRRAYQVGSATVGVLHHRARSITVAGAGVDLGVETFRWVPDHADPLPGMRHSACGGDFNPITTCGSCGEPTSEKDVVAQWGPSGSWQRSIPVATATRRRPESGHAAGLFPQTMSVMGNRWGFAILVAAFVGVSRFTDFQTQLGAPPGSIADRLSNFTANGVFEVSDNRYRLTEKGRALFPSW